MRTHRLSIQLSALIAVCLSAVISLPAHAEDYAAPGAIALDAANNLLIVAESGLNKLALVDIASRTVAQDIALSVSPSGIAIAPAGNVAYVSGGAENGKVVIVDLKGRTETGSFDAGHTPMSPVLSPDGKTLYICSRFTNEILVADVAAKTVVARIPASREPVAMAITPDGTRLAVANLLPAGASDGDFTAAAVTIVDCAAKQACATISLPNGSSGVRGVCISPDGRFAYFTHILARYHMPTTQLERGWMNTNALTIINVPEAKAVNSVLLDDVDLGAANPWGVACSADAQRLVVAHAGTHEISVIDLPRLHEKLDKVAGGTPVTEVSQKPEDVQNDLSFLVGIRKRVKLAGNGARDIVLAGDTAFATEHFSDTVGSVDLAAGARAKAQQIALGAKKEMSVQRKGEMFFNDAALCFQHWQSCASCHPDSRVDGVNWDLMNDGMGNPKNTKSMLFSHETPPVMSLGVRDNAEMAVRAGIKFIQFAVRPEEDAVAIDEYLKSMKPIPSPHKGESVQRGKAVFEKAGCADCHSGQYYTDKSHYIVGTESNGESEFDTPTLCEVWRTAPYLHDGRAATLKDMLTKFNTDDSHGKTSKLTEAELNDLIAYVSSL